MMTRFRYRATDESGLTVEGDLSAPSIDVARQELAHRGWQVIELTVEWEGEAPAEPFVSWMLICGERQGTLITTLRQVAEVLRQRAASDSDWLRIMLPTVLVVGVGGTAVLTYALAVFVPMSQLLRALGEFNP